jgi:hypothetical protein
MHAKKAGFESQAGTGVAQRDFLEAKKEAKFRGLKVGFKAVSPMYFEDGGWGRN